MEKLKLIFCLLVIQFVSFSTQQTTDEPETSEESSCGIISCEDPITCSVRIDYDACECVYYNCRTTPIPTPDPTACEVPCSGRDRFCTYVRNPETCECEVQYCCTPLHCPTGYEVCDSCSNCRCNPPDFTTTESPERPTPSTVTCTLWCPDKDGCRTIYNYDECRCDYECTDTTPGPTTCEPVECQGSDRFCEYRINSETCECEPFVCCSPPYCPNGFEVCDSCSNCRCNPDITTPPYTTTEPPSQCTPIWCPDKDGCRINYNYDECRCDYDCTDTTPGPTTCEPVECQGSDRFCEYRINSETCECEPFVCCSTPYCPNGFEVCDSCSNCRCNPDITTPPYTTTEPPPQCTLWCPDKDGCKTIYNYNECRCDYDCTATTPSSKVFKCVQI